AHLVPRTRNRGPAVAREAPSRRHVRGRRRRGLPVPASPVGDRRLYLAGNGKSADKAYYASSSRELASGVAHLLARLGIVARIRQVGKAGYQPGYHVIVADGPSLRTFCERGGVHGRRGETARQVAAAMAGRTVN